MLVCSVSTFDACTIPQLAKTSRHSVCIHQLLESCSAEFALCINRDQSRLETYLSACIIMSFVEVFQKVIDGYFDSPFINNLVTNDQRASRRTLYFLRI